LNLDIQTQNPCKKRTTLSCKYINVFYNDYVILNLSFHVIQLLIWLVIQ